MADRKLLLVKNEDTYGVDSEPAAADAVWAEDVRYRPLGQLVRGNPAHPGYDQVPGHMVMEYAELEFRVPLAASGVAGTAPKWGKIAKACGLAETIVNATSVTYAPMADTSGAPSEAIYWREGRRKHVMLGARGVMSLSFRANERPMGVIKMKGLVTDVTTADALVANNANWAGWVDAKPITKGRTSFAFAGEDLPFYELALEHNDRAVFKDLPNQENVQLLGPRTITGSVKAGTPLPSDLNLEALASAQTRSTLALVHNVGVAGHILTLNAGFANEKPDYVDEQGEDAFTAALTYLPSAIGGHDSFSLVLT